MRHSFWLIVSVLALGLGVLIGYGIWGPNAARLPEVENQLSVLQSQIADIKRKGAELEANLGKAANDRSNLEKENADLKDALAKAQGTLAKTQRAAQERPFKRRR